MLLDRFTQITAMFFISVFFISCGQNDEPKPVDYSSPEVLKETAFNVLNIQPAFTAKGDFVKDTLVQIVAGIEVENTNEWGIKFSLLMQQNDVFDKIFETPLLDGSFKECQVNKIKFPSTDYELVYYSSKSFFMGSGGGEVFSYVIDFVKKEIYKAHLISDDRGGAKLYISENITDAGIKNFFVGNNKRDYPGLTLISKDIDLNN
ncbi:MAG: hypothetical protein K8H86_14180 [Ignavibacteriaceae bacterium]|nr:hypothetical protein [Ignavibacteriaceae bacterium]